jgi:hypothetical protein
MVKILPQVEMCSTKSKTATAQIKKVAENLQKKKNRILAALQIKNCKEKAV